MKKNIGTVDKSIRVLAAIVIGILLFTGQLSGTLGIVLGVFAVAFLLTSAMSFCPIYTLFKISTRRAETAK
jgi:hypothetical protein